MNREVIVRATVFFLLVFSLAPTLSLAQTVAPTQNSLPGRIVTCSGAIDSGGLKACTVCDLATLAQNVLNTGIYMAVLLSAFLFAWAGWVYMTAMGDSGKVTKARSVFTNVAIGLVIILVGWLVIDTLMKALVDQNGPFGPWNKIC